MRRVGQIDPRFVQPAARDGGRRARLPRQPANARPHRRRAHPRGGARAGCFAVSRLPHARHPRLFRHERHGRSSMSSRPRRDSACYGGAIRDLDSLARRHARRPSPPCRKALRARCVCYNYEHRIEGGALDSAHRSRPAALPHDPKALLLSDGGRDLCGHAGLFSTAKGHGSLCAGASLRRAAPAAKRSAKSA